MSAGYRGRLIFPFLAEIARLDTYATAQDPDLAGPLTSGYDKDFREVVVVPETGKQIGHSARKEHPLVRVPCQVEPAFWEGLQALQTGDAPKSNLGLVFHYGDLESMSLVDPLTGDALLRVDDRLVAMYDINGALVQSVRTPPGLYITEARPIGHGLNQEKPYRNLLLCSFADREQGTTGRGA